MAKRRKGRTNDRGVEEDSDEMVVVATIHDARVKLTHVDKRVERVDGRSWPRRVNSVRKEDGPVLHMGCVSDI